MATLRRFGARNVLLLHSEVSQYVLPADLAALIVVIGDKEPPLALIKQAAPLLRQNGAAGGALLAGVTALDGGLGFRNLADISKAPRAAILGIIKSISHEWPEVSCRVIDIDPDWQGPLRANKIANALQAGLPLEVGLTADAAYQLILEKVDQEAIAEWRPDAGEVVVVSGGARGVTAHIARKLAHSGVKLHLLGRSAMPEELPEWCKNVASLDEMKQAVMANTAELLTPKMVQGKAKKLMVDSEILATLAACREQGAEVNYHSIDVTDGAAIKELIGEITEQEGPVSALVHGAGVLADNLFTAMSDEDYWRVYNTKVVGFNNLLAACGNSLKHIVLFSSTTARLGRRGQSNYAAANEVLNKSAEAYQRTHQNCLVKAMGWGPWAGGMVNSSLARLFSEEGIGLIDLEAGADLLARELAETKGAVEVVVLKAGSLLPAELFVPVEPKTATGDFGELAFKSEISLESVPVLASHALGDHYVVPFALALEWLLEGALVLAPGKNIASINNVRLLSGLKLGVNEAIAIYVCGKKTNDNSMLLSILNRRGGVLLPAYQAEVVLSDELPEVSKEVIKLSALRKVPLKVADIYKKYLFHGRKLVAFTDKPALSAAGARVHAHVSGGAQEWLKDPLSDEWLGEPLLLDGCFQLAIVWSTEQLGEPCLPVSVGKYSQYVTSFPSTSVEISMRLKEQNGKKLFFDISLSSGNKLLAFLEDYEALMDGRLTEAFAAGRKTGAGVP